MCTRCTLSPAALDGPQSAAYHKYIHTETESCLVVFNAAKLSLLHFYVLPKVYVALASHDILPSSPSALFSVSRSLLCLPILLSFTCPQRDMLQTHGFVG